MKDSLKRVAIIILCFLFLLVIYKGIVYALQLGISDGDALNSVSIQVVPYGVIGGILLLSIGIHINKSKKLLRLWCIVFGILTAIGNATIYMIYR